MPKKIKRVVVPTGCPCSPSTGDFAGYVGSCMDIAERKQAADQLRQNQRMEMLVKLSHGIAHDFNNIMTVIKGHAECLKMKRAEDASLVKALNAILAASDRAIQYTSNMNAQLSCLEIDDLNQVTAPHVAKDANRKEHNTPELKEFPMGREVIPSVLEDAGFAG